jgi:hypothetical protein
MMTWDELCGEHILMAVRRDVRHPFDANADGGAFQLDNNMTVFVFEDPSDGYRSCATEPMVVSAPLYSFGCDVAYIRAPVLVRRWERSEYGQADGIEIIDKRNGKTILYAGTDNSDDYYPSYTFDWRPQELAENAAA